MSAFADSCLVLYLNSSLLSTLLCVRALHMHTDFSLSTDSTGINLTFRTESFYTIPATKGAVI